MFTIDHIKKSACASRNQFEPQVSKWKQKQSEESIQMSCVRLFRFKYPQYAKRFFSIPNGGKRNAFEAHRMKLTGTLPGVWDLFLSVPKGRWHGLFIEMKALKGKLTELQIEFRKANEQDYRFEVCNSLETFEKVIEEYLTN